MMRRRRRRRLFHPNSSPYTVSYNTESHFSILTQLWGSQWPKVLPYCLFSVALMVGLTVIDQYVLPKASLEINVSRQGHIFVNFVVSFLLLSRVRNSMERYNHACDDLNIMIRETREIVAESCVLSCDNRDDSARAWRHEIAYRSLILLRTAMAVMDFPTKQKAIWDVPELNGFEKEYVLNHRVHAKDMILRLPQHVLENRSCHVADSDDSLWEESLRIPVCLEYLLQTTLRSQRMRLLTPIVASQEGRIYTSISSFMVGYSRICKFFTTPIPFPLIQMARTILFLYVYTIPFVLLGDTSSLLAHSAMMFVFTYGFVGLELIAIELDNPFGADPNDFDHNGMAMTVYEDVYLLILDIDGPEWTDKLRLRMLDPTCPPPYPVEQRWMAETFNSV